MALSSFSTLPNVMKICLIECSINVTARTVYKIMLRLSPRVHRKLMIRCLFTGETPVISGNKLERNNSKGRAIRNRSLRVSSPLLRVCGCCYLIIFSEPLLRSRSPRYTGETWYISQFLRNVAICYASSNWFIYVCQRL